MKKSLILICTTIFSFYTFSQINFDHDSFESLKQKARKENKLIFVDAYTSWCGPCKWMAANIFTKKQVGEFYNSNFICAKIDMEKGEGVELAKSYQINAFPTLLFIDGNGKLIHRAVGSREADPFIQLGKDAIDPAKQFAGFEEKYKSGNREPQFLSVYLNVLSDVGLGTEKVYKEYFETQKEPDYTNRTNWNIIEGHVWKKDNPQFSYLINHRNDFAKLYTADSVNSKIYGVYSYELQTIVYGKNTDTAAYQKLKNEIRQLRLSNEEKLFLSNDMDLFSKMKMFDAFGNSGIAYLEKYSANDANTMNNIAFEIYQKCDNKAVLAKAEGWAKKATELLPNDPANMDTYACLMFKNNKKAEAVKLETEALNLIKSNPEKHDQSMIAEFEKNISDWSK